MDLIQYAAFALARSARCMGRCHEASRANEIEHYDHNGGWQVDGFAKRQWLYFECRRCGYQTSFSKLEIPGKATYEEQKILDDADRAAEKKTRRLLGERGERFSNDPRLQGWLTFRRKK